MRDGVAAIERTGTPTVEPQDSLRTVALSVAQRLLPGAGVPELRHLALLAETEAIDLPRRWTDHTARTLSALLSSRARRDAISDGPALIGKYFEGTHLTRPAGLSPGARSELLASAGEYLCAVGSPHAGARFGEEAQLFADTDARRYRALAVTSLGLAANGEFERAVPVMRAADDLFRDNGWDARERSFLLLLGALVVAAARTDQDDLRAIGAELSVLARGNPYLDYAARTTEVFCCLIRGEYADGIAATWQLLHSSRRHSSQRMIRDALRCARSALFLAQNLHADALATVSGARSPEGHGTCYEAERASALLLLGRDRDALRETDACAASLDDHCLRPLPRLMLVRAIAYRRTGQERRARQSVASALLLIARTGNSRAPFLMLPADECAALIESAVSEHPELATMAVETSAILDRLAAPAPSLPLAQDLPEFTPTERTLAKLLVTPPQPGRDRARAWRLGQHDQESRAIHLRQARRQQPRRGGRRAHGGHRRLLTTRTRPGGPHRSSATTTRGGDSRRNPRLSCGWLVLTSSTWSRRAARRGGPCHGSGRARRRTS